MAHYESPATPAARVKLPASPAPGTCCLRAGTRLHPLLCPADALGRIPAARLQRNRVAEGTRRTDAWRHYYGGAAADARALRVPDRRCVVQPALRLRRATGDGPAAHRRRRPRHPAVPAPGRTRHRPRQQAAGLSFAGRRRRHRRRQPRAGLRARPARLPDRPPDARPPARHRAAATDDEQSAQAGGDSRRRHRRGRTCFADRQPEPGERPLPRDQGSSTVAFTRRHHA